MDFVQIVTKMDLKFVIFVKVSHFFQTSSDPYYIFKSMVFNLINLWGNWFEQALLLVVIKLSWWLIDLFEAQCMSYNLRIILTTHFFWGRWSKLFSLYEYWSFSPDKCKLKTILTHLCKQIYHKEKFTSDWEFGL